MISNQLNYSKEFIPEEEQLVKPKTTKTRTAEEYQKKHQYVLPSKKSAREFKHKKVLHQEIRVA